MYALCDLCLCRTLKGWGQVWISIMIAIITVIDGITISNNPNKIRSFHWQTIFMNSLECYVKEYHSFVFFRPSPLICYCIILIFRILWVVYACYAFTTTPIIFTKILLCFFCRYSCLNCVPCGVDVSREWVGEEREEEGEVIRAHAILVA